MFRTRISEAECRVVHGLCFSWRKSILSHNLFTKSLLFKLQPKTNSLPRRHFTYTGKFTKIVVMETRRAATVGNREGQQQVKVT